MQEIEDLEERIYYENKGIKPKPEFEKEIERETKKARLLQSGQEDGDANDNDNRGQAESDANAEPDHSSNKAHEKSRQATSTFKKAVIPNDELDLELQPLQQDRKSGKKKSRKTSQDKQITLQPLKNSSIRTSGKLKISQLKKYLVNQLTLDPSHVLELRCNGDTVGDELSLTFIQRTRWLKPDEDMVLGYRLSQDRVTNLPKPKHS